MGLDLDSGLGALNPVAAIGSIGSAGVTGYMNYQQQKKQNQWSAKMSNTAYQRAVRDMEAAGINPALAYKQGGASAPTSSQMSYEAPDLADAVISSARVKNETALAENTVAKTGQEVENLKAQEALTKMDTVLKANQAKIIEKDLAPSQFKSDLGEAGMNLMKPILDSIKNSAKPHPNDKIQKYLKKGVDSYKGPH